MMRRTAVVVLLAALGSWNGVHAQSGRYMSQAHLDGSPDIEGAHNGAYYPPTAIGFVGPGGAPVPISAPPASQVPSTGEMMAQLAIANQLPPEIVQQILSQQGRAMPLPGMAPNPIQQVGGPGCPGPGCPVGPGGPGGPGLPGGFGGPGLPGGPPIAGAVAAVGALTGPPASPFPALRSSVRFTSPNGMTISWFAPTADGKAGFGAQYLTVPGAYNFPQAAIYRLKLENLPNRREVKALYPTLEVVPCNARTATFLAHSSIPVSFTEEDLDQVAQGNFLVKVIYLPDPQFQEVGVGTEEIISTRLEPGVDPIAEAHRRGNILLIVRLGNIDLELAHSPPLTAPSQYQPQGCLPQMQGQQGSLPQMQLPPKPPVQGPGPAQQGPVTTNPVFSNSVQQVGYRPVGTRPATPAELASPSSH
jgi:hypothetical protein